MINQPGYITYTKLWKQVNKWWEDLGLVKLFEGNSRKCTEILWVRLGPAKLSVGWIITGQITFWGLKINWGLVSLGTFSAGVSGIGHMTCGTRLDWSLRSKRVGEMFLKSRLYCWNLGGITQAFCGMDQDWSRGYHDVVCGIGQKF